jgi:hypothetical protein
MIHSQPRQPVDRFCLPAEEADSPPVGFRVWDDGTVTEVRRGLTIGRHTATLVPPDPAQWPQ